MTTSWSTPVVFMMNRAEMATPVLLFERVLLKSSPIVTTTSKSAATPAPLMIRTPSADILKKSPLGPTVSPALTNSFRPWSSSSNRKTPLRWNASATSMFPPNWTRIRRPVKSSSTGSPPGPVLTAKPLKMTPSPSVSNDSINVVSVSVPTSNTPLPLVS